MTTGQSDRCSTPIHPHQDPYRWLIMALAASAFVMAFVSRFAWPPVMPAVMPVMNIDRTEGLAYMSAFYIGYIITQIPGGILADRFGPRLVLSTALLLQGLGTLGLGYTENYQTGFILRIICGLGGGCVYSSCLKATVNWFSPTQRALALAVVMSAPTIGVSLPNFIMPALESGFGWQGAFRAVGWAVLATAILLALFMRDIRVASGPRKNFLVGLKYVAANRNLVLIALVGFTSLWVQIGFSSVGNDYLVNTFGLNLKAAGGVMVLYGLAGLVTSILSGYLSGRFPARKKTMLILCHVFLAGFCLCFGQLGSAGAVVLGACLIGMAVSFGNVLYSVVVAGNTAPEWMATAGGVSNSIFQIGALLSPVVIGRAVDLSGNFGLVWWILALGAAAGAVIAAFLRPWSQSGE